MMKTIPNININPKKIYNRANSLKWEEKNSLPCLIARPIVVKIVAKLTQDRKNTLLDIGCGTGRWTKLLAKGLKKVVGIDIVKEMIEICREKNTAPNIIYKQVDMFKLRQLFQKSEFDIVATLMVLQYAKNKKELLNLCRDINFLLKPKGHFVFLVTHPFAILTNKSKWDKYFSREGVSYFENFNFTGKIRLTDNDWKNVGATFHSFSEYLNCATEAGFRIIKIYEPKPSPALIAKYPDMKYDALWPTCLIVHAQKE